MTHIEAIAKLKKFHEEELQDVEKYREFAKHLPEGMECIICDIADEEHTHAKHIEHMIEEMEKHEWNHRI